MWSSYHSSVLDLHPFMSNCVYLKVLVSVNLGFYRLIHYYSIPYILRRYNATRETAPIAMRVITIIMM